MTAYVQRDIALDALQKQCNGFIDKPFTLEQLLQEIDRVKSNKLKAMYIEKSQLLQPVLFML
jgi:CheY-like chemotaxis protein